jgi:hypothetical protein
MEALPQNQIRAIAFISMLLSSSTNHIQTNVHSMTLYALKTHIPAEFEPESSVPEVSICDAWTVYCFSLALLYKK